MVTKIVSDKMLRWKGDLGAVKELSVKAQQLVEKKTGSKPACTVRTTFKKVETLFDSADEFEAAMGDDFTRLQRIVLTIGPFDRDAELSAEIVLSKAATEPGAAVWARGHDEAYVEWLGNSLLQLLKQGRRKFPLTSAQVYWILLVMFLVGQYFFYQMVTLPPMGDLAAYIVIIAASVAPISLIYLNLWVINWIIPQLELLTGKTRWETYRKRAVLAIGAVTGAVLAPIFVSFIQKQMGL